MTDDAQRAQPPAAPQETVMDSLRGGLVTMYATIESTNNQLTGVRVVNGSEYPYKVDVYDSRGSRYDYVMSQTFAAHSETAIDLTGLNVREGEYDISTELLVP